MLRSCAIAAVLLLAASSLGETIIFHDSEFAESDWDLTIFWTLGDGGMVDAWQATSGGYPGSYRQIWNLVHDAPPYAAVAGFHRHLASVYDPVEGAILSLDYAEDAIMLVGGGQGQGAGPALRQDGEVYVTDAFLTPQTWWTSHELLGLTATDFHRRDVPTAHPDFSPAGGVIEFGFARQNSTFSGGYTILGGIDNWSLTLHTQPPVAVEGVTWSAVKALFD